MLFYGIFYSAIINLKYFKIIDIPNRWDNKNNMKLRYPGIV